MRTLSIAALCGAALLAAGPAAAQVYSPGPTYYNDPAGAPIPAPGYGGGMVSTNPPYLAGPAPQVPTAGARVWQDGRWMALPPQSAQFGGSVAADRWGASVDGRWWGGSRAPGGWGGYRRLGRGSQLPGYWMGGSFRVPDYLSFGLAAPPQGYFWVRYYDDAVLVDGQGRVWDSLGGIAWAGASAQAGGGYSSSHSYSHSSAGASYAAPIRQIDPNAYYGYPGGGYASPAAPLPPAVQVQPYGGGYHQGQGYYQGGSSYQAGGYYAGGYSSGSTVVITSAPVTTTTVVEEIIEEEVVTTTSYVSAPVKRVVRRAPAPRKYRPRPRPKAKCCVCVCR